MKPIYKILMAIAIIATWIMVYLVGYRQGLDAFVIKQYELCTGKECSGEEAARLLEGYHGSSEEVEQEEVVK